MEPWSTKIPLMGPEKKDWRFQFILSLNLGTFVSASPSSRSLSHSISLSRCLSFSITLNFIFPSLSFDLSLSMSVFRSLYISLTLPLSLCLCCLPISLSLSLYLLSFSIPSCLAPSYSHYLFSSFCVSLKPAFLNTIPPTRLASSFGDVWVWIEKRSGTLISAKTAETSKFFLSGLRKGGVGGERKKESGKTSLGDRSNKINPFHYHSSFFCWE